ncbi:DUF1361 domain-containing protein [Treponema sp. OttesenSCG-928-L16]|nr:DUF1361 domain-containing protein [Treponema sp. OttesenSCG-928-L16]
MGHGINMLKEKNKSDEILLLGILSLFCLGLSIFRAVYTQTKMFLFLNWNLFLAFIPWCLTTLSVIKPGIKSRKIGILFLLFFWLLFFPNAPYILTDLFHLRLRTSMPIWFDVILILSFAWTGLLFGFLSLWDIENIFSEKIQRKYVTLLAALVLFIGSFGIYLGRYLRWNSWDIIREPVLLFRDITDRVADPFSYPGAWGMTVLWGVFLNMMYWSIRLLGRKNRTARQPAKEFIPKKP